MGHQLARTSAALSLILDPGGQRLQRLALATPMIRMPLEQMLRGGLMRSIIQEGQEDGRRAGGGAWCRDG